MFARNKHDSSDFGLESLEARSLLSAAPIPDASQATLLNGTHPVADASFLNPTNEDWTVAQGGHDSGPPPFLNDNDMYDFSSTQTGADDTYDDAWADHWDPMTDAELGDINDGGPIDLSGITGPPAKMTLDQNSPVAPTLTANAPMQQTPGTPTPDAPITVAPTATAPVNPIPALHPADAAPASTFIETGSGRNSFDPDASLYTFGTKSSPSFLNSDADKQHSVIASFVSSSSSDLPLSADLVGLPLIV